MKFKPKVKPYEHQRRGLQWLWSQPDGGAYFWDPGTGKTKGAYDYVAASYLFRGIRRVLVVCPINALQVWDDQADRHIPDPITFVVHLPSGSIAQKAAAIREIQPDPEELTIVAINYAAIIKRDNRWEIMRALREFDPDILILDESHHIKGATTKQAKASHFLADSTPKVLALTGTPLGKNNLDLYSQLRAINPRIWRADWTRTGIMTWTDFKNQYAIFGGKTGYQILRFTNVDDLERRIKPHIRSARKEDIHDMPEVTDTIIPVEMPADARRAYDIFAAEGLVVYKRHLVEAPIPLTKLLRLQQMTGGWVHDEAGDSFQFQDAKITVLADLFADLRQADRSVVVFARFLAEMDAIYDAGVRYYKGNTYRIQGKVSADGRRSVVRDFTSGNRPGCLVVQVAAAEALDGLQRVASEAVFYSTDYSLIHWSQARGRLDRVGQTRPVTFYHLHAKGTVDGLILEALQAKKDIEKLVMDHPEILISR